VSQLRLVRGIALSICCPHPLLKVSILSTWTVKRISHFNPKMFEHTKKIETVHYVPVNGVHRFMMDWIGETLAWSGQPPLTNFKFPGHEAEKFPAGAYVRNAIGIKHAPSVDVDGCTIIWSNCCKSSRIVG
jgi:hypothetical protein